MLYEEIVEVKLADLAASLSIYSDFGSLEGEEVSLISEYLDEHRLCCKPEFQSGFISRDLSSSIFVYRREGVVDKKSTNFRYASLLARVAIILARIDSEILDIEVTQILSFINTLTFLSHSERLELKATVLYALRPSGSTSSEIERDYVKVALKKELVLSQIEKLSEPAKLQLVEIAKQVIAADGIVRHQEVEFLKDIYRTIGWSARGAREDLKKYAKRNSIELNSEKNKTEKLEELYGTEDVLGEIFSDFGEFLNAD